MFVAFHGLNFELPQGWADITDELPEGAPPSLARLDGVGALQFTLAKYRSGDNPSITVTELRNFLNDLFSIKNMICSNIIEYSGRIISVQGGSNSDDELVLARYFSNGKDIALVTYVCSDPNSAEVLKDLKDVNIIMDSVEF